MREEALTALRDLNEVVETLRAPGGCPWDREQTHETLRPYLLEETYEVLEAIESSGATLREELGDVLLQVLMHAAIAQERGDNGFDIGDIADTTRAKMIGRHPHVFGDTAVGGAAEVVVNWERLKAAEKGDRMSVLDGVPRSLPALAYALGVQKRPARVGFDETPSVNQALADLAEAVHVFEVADQEDRALPAVKGEDWNISGPGTTEISPPGHAAPPPARPEMERAVGDLLFAVVALSRRLRVNPEDALRRRATEFGQRFRAVESGLRREGGDVHGTTTDEWERRWKEADRG